MSFIAPVVSGFSSMAAGIGGVAKSVGPIIQAVSGYANASAERQAYDGQANVAAYNAAVANQSAGVTESIATQDEAIERRKKRSALSSIQASAGARGINLSGSPLLDMMETAAELELNIQNDKFNSRVEAGRLRSQAVSLGMESENYRKTGKNRFRASGISTAYKIFSEF